MTCAPHIGTFQEKFPWFLVKVTWFSQVNQAVIDSCLHCVIDIDIHLNFVLKIEIGLRAATLLSLKVVLWHKQ